MEFDSYVYALYLKKKNVNTKEKNGKIQQLCYGKEQDFDQKKYQTCVFIFALAFMKNNGSIALLSHFHKVLAHSKFTLLKCKIEVNPIARIPQATSTVQLQFAQSWWPRESMLRGSLQFRTLKV